MENVSRYIELCFAWLKRQQAKTVAAATAAYVKSFAHDDDKNDDNNGDGDGDDRWKGYSLKILCHIF